jgi:hypothetical protein
MSYFMVAVGQKPELSDLPHVEAVALTEAQEYLQKLASDLRKAHRAESIWFIHDGETGTSHNFIVAATENAQLESSLAGTILERVLQACENAGDSFRIWYADVPGAHLDVDRFSTLDMAEGAIVEQIRSGADVAVVYGRKG